MTHLLAELNRDIWRPFVAAYVALDAATFLALNHPDLIRVSGAANQVQGDTLGLQTGQQTAEAGSGHCSVAEENVRSRVHLLPLSCDGS